MKQPNPSVKRLQIKSVIDRRHVVTKINEFDDNNGIGKSQRAKYEKPMWYYVACILNGSDRTSAFSQTDMVEILAGHGIVVSKMTIARTLKLMTNLDESIQPQRRNCGVGCYEAVRALGGIQDNGNWSSVEENLYWFGKHTNSVNYYRRSFNIRLEP
jgi:hypothetical protein